MAFTARFIFAVTIATVAMVAWGMVFWGSFSEPLGVFNGLPDDAGVRAALQASNPATGTYFSPFDRSTPEKMNEWLGMHRSGPFFKLSYVREGADPQSPSKMAGGVLHYLVVSLIAAGIVLLGGAERPRVARFGMVFLAGMMGTVFIQFGDVVWFHLPLDYPLGNLIYETGCWALLGGILAPLLPGRSAGVS